MAAIRAALKAGASKAAVCRTFGVKRSTLYDALARVEAASGPSGGDPGHEEKRGRW